MNERKNIERLFQEKFKDFEVEPSEKVWKNIESKLKEKKEKRKVMPLWLKLSGIAATLLVGFFTTEYVLNAKKDTDPRIVIEDNQPGNPEVNSTKNTQSIITSADAASTNAATEKTNPDNALENSTISPEVSVTGNNQKINATNQTVARTEVSKDKTEKNSRVNTSGKMKNNATVADGDTKKDTKSKTFLKKNAKGKNNSVSPLKYNTNTAIVMNEAEKSSKKNSKKKGFKNKKNNSSSIAAVSKSNETIQIKNNVPSDANSGLANQNSIEKPASETNPLVASNQVAILKDADSIKTTDSTAIAANTPNALEELLKEKQKETTTTVKAAKEKKWHITSNVASVYYGSLSNGSPLDTLFKNNNKEYKTNLAYGLGVKYALDTKFSVRTGVNAVALEYNTNDVVFYQNKNAVSIQHVKNNLQGSLIQVESKHAPTVDPNAPVTKFDGNLNQKTGYIEVPLELSYKIIDKKFGIEVIGGLSTLFLNENKVSLISSGMNMDIGEADNLNKLHFSTNIGLGLKYNFFKSFQINFDPMFKYQLNTYNDDSGNFKPYFFGLYTGISFRF